MTQPESFTPLQRALQYAEGWHSGQVRKGTSIPYFSHLLGVAALALEFGADEGEAIAALLHDALEDGPANTGLTPADLRGQIAQQFGERVARLVDAATDARPEPGQPKPAWNERKATYLNHLPTADPSALLVSACDKLYNLRSILVDLLTGPVGDDVFSRFKAGQDGTLQYYRLLADQYQRTATRQDVAGRPRLLALFSELERTVLQLEAATQTQAEDVRRYPLLSGRIG